MRSIVIALLWAGPAFAGTRYVDVSLASGANDGSSWSNAHQGVDGIQSALALAVAGDEIWVANGTYKPTATLTRSISIHMKSGVAVLGGFAGGETLASQADPSANPTVISGDLANNEFGIPEDWYDNSFHLVSGGGADATAILDGFTLQRGNANLPGHNQNHGGAFLFLGSSHVTVRRCVVRDNRSLAGGAAGYILDSSPTFTDCIFDSNVSNGNGGAFDAGDLSGATFDRCVFSSNHGNRGGGIKIFGNASTKVSNSLFVRNHTQRGGDGGGAAIWVDSTSTATIRNCTITRNGAAGVGSQTGGIYSAGGAVSVVNCIVYSNSGINGAQGAAQQIFGSAVSVSHSCVQHGHAGAGNFDALPMFIDRNSNDYRLRLGSRCIDAGDNAAVPSGVVIDLAGNPRFIEHPAVGDLGAGTQPRVDIGAYEAEVHAITSYCFGDGEEIPCPCDNHTTVGSVAGCTHSIGWSATLAAVGTASLSADTLVLDATAMTGAGAGFALLLQGSRIAQLPFNDGHLCLNGTIVRLDIVQHGGAATFPAPGDPSLSIRGGVADPGPRAYQVQYRNAVSFCTGATVNQTNGVSVIWAP